MKHSLYTSAVQDHVLQVIISSTEVGGVSNIFMLAVSQYKSRFQPSRVSRLRTFHQCVRNLDSYQDS